MEIRDPVHGSIDIQDVEIPIIEHPLFSRLRNIKQLGFSEYVFPGATHTRFLHSVGVMHIAQKVFDKLFKKYSPSKELERIRETFKLACLLHDVGHAPLSHTTEVVMPSTKELNIPSPFSVQKPRQATHEDFTIKAIIDSDFSESFKKVQDQYAVDLNQIACLILGKNEDDKYFCIEGINFFPILHQLVSSELDCDRMDYLLRDSYFCGVSYGKFDLDWIIDNIGPAIIDNKAYLGLSERAVVTFDDFLLSRFHMFVMVYFHYRAVCLEQILFKFFKTSDEYRIPADLTEYVHHDDHFLMKALRNSTNPFAKRIISNNIPQKVFESFNIEQQIKLDNMVKYCDEESIDYIHCSSSSRLSKYYGNEDLEVQYPLKVIRSGFGLNENQYSDIEKTTKLFQKFSKSHSISRLHLDVETLSSAQKTQLFSLINS